MPHQCTNCGHRFEDGSKEMLSGCPSCDGNKFQFIPAGRDPPHAGSTGADGTATSSPATSQSTTSSSTSDAAAPETGGKSRGSSSATDATTSESTAPSDATATSDATAPSDATVTSDATADATPEDDAQTSARSSLVSSEELEEARRKMADAEEQRMAEVDGESTDADGSTNLKALRDELNDQFESIKIKAPGQYELNLMELYDREEYIISLREDGKYVIEMPETWRDDE